MSKYIEPILFIFDKHCFQIHYGMKRTIKLLFVWTQNIDYVTSSSLYPKGHLGQIKQTQRQHKYESIHIRSGMAFVTNSNTRDHSIWKQTYKLYHEIISNKICNNLHLALLDFLWCIIFYLVVLAYR